MIKNVIFDLDGVIRGTKKYLIKDLFPERLDCTFLAKYENVKNNDIIAKYKYLSVFEDWDKGFITSKDVLQKVLKHKEDPEDIIVKSFNVPLERKNNFLYEDTINLIKKLRLEGYKTFILSNMNSDIIKMLYSGFLDFSLFDGVILSSQIGLIKPYPEIYQYAVDKWKINAKESIFIDDREINLKQFEKLGGKTFLFDKFNTSKSVEFLYKKIKNEK